MTPGSRAKILQLAPARMPEMLHRSDVRVLVVSDAACAQPLAVDALALYAATRDVRDISFWGRQAAFHQDRLRELATRHGAEIRLRALRTFDPIDILNEAERISDAAAGADGATLAILDIEAPLDAKLLDALAHSAEIRPLSPPRTSVPT